MAYFNTNNAGWYEYGYTAEDHRIYNEIAQALTRVCNNNYTQFLYWNENTLVQNSNMLRLFLKMCLYARDGVEIKTPIVISAHKASITGQDNNSRIKYFTEAIDTMSNTFQDDEIWANRRAINVTLIRRGSTFAFNYYDNNEDYEVTDVTRNLMGLLGVPGKVYIRKDKHSIVTILKDMPSHTALAKFYACVPRALDLDNEQVTRISENFFNNNFDVSMRAMKDTLSEVIQQTKIIEFKNALKQTRTTIQRNLQNNIRRYKNDMDSYEAEWQKCLTRMTEAQNQLNGIKLNNDDERETKMFEEIMNNKSVEYVDMRGNYMVFNVTTPIIAYRPSAVKPYIRNTRHPIGASESLSYVFQKVFVEQDYKPYFNMRLYLPINANRAADIQWEVVEKTLPNPHISQYNCWSQHSHEAFKFLSAGKYPDAITQCIVALGSIEFDDAAVVNAFAHMLAGDYWETKCFKNNDGAFVSAKEIWEAREK